MQQNIGLFDRYIRLVGGLVALTGSTQMRRHSLTKAALIAVGAMKVAEGVTGWCPVMYACGIQTTDDGKQIKASASSNQAPNQSTKPSQEKSAQHQQQSENTKDTSASTQESQSKSNGLHANASLSNLNQSDAVNASYQ